jgi:hypothetical protein
MKRATIKDVTDRISKISFLSSYSNMERLRPSLYHSNMNAGQICNYSIDKTTRIAAISAFEGCIPAIGDIVDTYDELYVLASASKGYLTPPQKAKKKTLTRLLKHQLTDLANSCALLSAGNKELFLLTGFGTRKPNKKHHGSAEACEAKTNNKKGAGNMGVSCKAFDFITKFIIYYGISADYDSLTWQHQVGNSNQTIKGLTKGVAYYFIMVAIGRDGEGEWMVPIMRHVPFE